MNMNEQTPILAAYRYHNGHSISFPVVLKDQQYQIKIPSGAVIPICRFLLVQDGQPDAEFLHLAPNGVPCRLADLREYMERWRNVIKVIENTPCVPTPTTPKPQPEPIPTGAIRWRNGVAETIETAPSPANLTVAAFVEMNQSNRNEISKNYRERRGLK